MRKKRNLVRDREIHALCSEWLLANFEKLDFDKKLEVSVKILCKFGVTTIREDINVRNLTEEERKNIIALTERVLSRGYLGDVGSVTSDDTRTTFHNFEAGG